MYDNVLLCFCWVQWFDNSIKQISLNGCKFGNIESCVMKYIKVESLEGEEQKLYHGLYGYDKNWLSNVVLKYWVVNSWCKMLLVYEG